MTIKHSTQVFVANEDLSWQTVGEGVRRKILAYAPDMMLVKVAFETGSIGALHHHVHTQISYVESGTFEVTVGEGKQILQAGDTFYAPSNVWHGVVCLAAGTLLDTFTPMREDFLL